jgi:heme/copper-type cytochrome/quinol oxidase subunit 4
MEKNKDSNKIGGLNVIIISIISFLYILMVTKLAEIFSSQYYSEGLDNEEDEKNQVGMYVMIIYFISIIGIIVGYIWFSNNKNTNLETPNWIIRWSLSIGGVLMLIYTIINYWEYLNDYSKLLLIFLSITSIIYYLYKYY